MTKVLHACGGALYRTKLAQRQLLRAMRILALLLTTCALNVSAYSDAQMITYSGVNKTLDEIFDVVGKQTGYSFVYGVETLKDTRKVTVSVKNMNITEFLKVCLESQPLEFFVRSKTVVIQRKKIDRDAFISTYKDPIEVLVRVSNEQGDPVAGVTIVVKGTPKIVATNADGIATIKNVDPQGILLLTAVNILPVETLIGGKKEIFIKVKGKTGKLDEVQIVGYGKTSQRYNVGNVISVKGEDISKQPVQNPLLALQGRVPGLHIVQESGIPGSGIQIQLRGQNSLSNGNEPLYIVDGVPFLSTLTGQQNIVSGGLAGAILGSSPSALSYINKNDIESIDVLKDAEATAIYGSRGANGVILITTKKGKSGKTSLDINISEGWSKVGSRMDYLSTPQYLEMRKEAYKNDGLQLPVNKIFNNYDITFWDQQKNTDWQEELIGNTGRNKAYQLSVGGGNSYLQYLISGNYQKESTVFPGKFYNEKFGANFNINGVSSNKKLRTNLSGIYNIDNNNLLSTDLTRFIGIAPNSPNGLNVNGTLNWQPLPNGTSTFVSNPYMYTKQPFEVQVKNLLANASMSYSLLESLELKVSAGYNNLESNSFSSMPFSSKIPELINVSLRESTFSSSSVKSIIAEPQLSYDLDFGKSEIKVLLGASYQKTNTTAQSIRATGFLSDESMRNLEAATGFFPTYRTSEYKYIAQFGRINYRFHEKYLVNFNLRRDGSSRFGPQKQYGNFYALGLGWLFSKENFFSRYAKWLSYGKIRFSYGTTGNDQIGDYRYRDLYTYMSTDGVYQGYMGVRTSGIYNSKYAWEATTKAELGFEIGLLKDRILFNGSLYRNKTDDQLLSVSLPDYVGLNNVIANSKALVQNDGLELVLNATAIKTKQFNWIVSFNTSFNRNRLLKEYNALSSNNVSAINDPKALGFGLFYNYLGIDPNTGLYLFGDKNGKPTNTPKDEDRVVYYNLRFPRFFGGIQNSFTVKEFQIDFLFHFVKKSGPVFMPSNQPGWFNVNQLESVLDRWQVPGDKSQGIKFNRTGTVVSNNYNQARLYSGLGYGDASYIRLKNISISYQIPNRVFRQIKIEKLKVFAQGQNMLTFTKYKGLDPETMNSLSLPPLKTFVIGLQCSF